MPRYDFKCPDGHVTEEIFTFADVPKEIQCPAGVEVATPDGGVEPCGAGAVRQISTGTWFINNKVMAPPSVRKAHSNIGDL
jgi:hypothetical protein